MVWTFQRTSTGGTARCDARGNRRLEREKDRLAEQNGELDTQLQGLTRKLELYEEELAWLKNRLYGRGTEKLSDAERQQLRLFDEIESDADADAEAEDEPPAADQAAGDMVRPRPPPKRKPLPHSLLRVERVIDLPEQDKQCACGHALVRIGEDQRGADRRDPAAGAGAAHGATEVRLPSLRGLRRRGSSGGAGGAGAARADPEGDWPARACWPTSPPPSSATRCRCTARSGSLRGWE